jgi:hypothetical protein
MFPLQVFWAALLFLHKFVACQCSLFALLSCEQFGALYSMMRRFLKHVAVQLFVPFVPLGQINVHSASKVNACNCWTEFQLRFDNFPVPALSLSCMKVALLHIYAFHLSGFCG